MGKMADRYSNRGGGVEGVRGISGSEVVFYVENKVLTRIYRDSSIGVEKKTKSM